MEKIILNEVINGMKSNINVIGQLLRESNKEVFWDDLDKLFEMKQFLDKLNHKFAKELI